MNSTIFTRQRIDPAVRRKFEAGAGWRYGLVFGILLVIAAWGWDAWLLASVSAEFFWTKLLLASVTVVPLCALAGALAARGAFLRKLFVWIGAGTLCGLIAIHLPFEGEAALAQLLDGEVRGLPLFQFPAAAAEQLIVTLIVATVLAIPIAVLQMVSVDWAWDRSDDDNRITRGGWALFLVSAPLALGFAAVYDSIIDAPLRAPLQLTHRIIELGIHRAPNLSLDSLDPLRAVEYTQGQSWREKFSEHYRQQLADYDPNNFKQAVVDATFDNGFIWRCEVKQYGDYLGTCVDLREQYREWMMQFLTSGIVHCEECVVVSDPPTLAWQSQRQAEFKNLQQVSLVHHSGGVVSVRATLGTNQVECKFVGANPMVIRDCAQQ